MANRKDTSEPLFYIEQPPLSSQIEQPGQRVVIKKQGKKKKKDLKLETSKDSQAKEQELSPIAEKTEKETDHLEEMIQYVKDLPHYIDPVIVCETKEKRIQGLVVSINEETVTLLNEVNQEEYTLNVKDIEKMYIISL